MMTLILVLVLLLKLNMFNGWLLALWIMAVADDVIGIIYKAIKNYIKENE